MPKCTYCGGTQFFEGPSGGMSVNILCANPKCRHWFNDTGPFGLQDLNRIEPTDDERKAARARAEELADLERLARTEQGRDAYRAGRDPESLRTAHAYGSYAEATSNIDRLVGYMQAMAADIAALKGGRHDDTKDVGHSDADAEGTGHQAEDARGAA